MEPDTTMLLPERPCSWQDCETMAVGLWLWKADDMTIGVAYCDEHKEIVKAALETAGRMAGGVALSDLKN